MALVAATYVLMELWAALLLLGFGLMLGARLAPREARRVAARVGAGGILGGLLGGAILSLGAPLIGSRELFLVAAALAVAPVFWLPSTKKQGRRSLHNLACPFNNKLTYTYTSKSEKRGKTPISHTNLP